MPELMIIIRP